MRGENDKNLLEQDWLIEVQMKIIDHFEMLFKKVFFIWTRWRVDILEKYNEKQKRNFQKVNRKTKYTWIEEDLENTMHEVLSIPGTSNGGVAKKFEIKESTLRFQLKKAKANEPLHKSGCK